VLSRNFLGFQVQQGGGSNEGAKDVVQSFLKSSHFGGTQRLPGRFLVLERFGQKIGERCATGLGDLQNAFASILTTLLPHDPTAGLQVIDDADENRLIEAAGSGQFDLGQIGIRID
jgi:hypothetical protein